MLKHNNKVNIYLPDTDGKTILKETAELSIPDNSEGYAELLIWKIIKGSSVENTSSAVPVDIFIRKIWFSENFCIIDLLTSGLSADKRVISGSEKIFKESLEKTITENIPSVKRIVILDRGIPGRNLWEF